MRSVAVRHRLMRIGGWVVLVLAFLGWVVSAAFQAPWTPWFTIVFWAVLGAAVVLRAVREARGKREPLDPFQGLTEIYQGRTQGPALEGPAAESSEIGYPTRNGTTSAPGE